MKKAFMALVLCLVPVLLGSQAFSPGTAAAPTDSPGAGTYGSTQMVTLADALPGATICYTDDDSTPTGVVGSCTNGTLYTTDITVSSTTTIKAIAISPYWRQSAVLSSVYTISAAGWTIIQGDSTTATDCSGATPIVCSISALTAGHAAYIGWGTWDGINKHITSITGGCAGSWAEATGAYSTSGAISSSSDIYYCENTNTDSSISIAHDSGAHAYAHVYEVAGMDSSSSLDVADNTSGSSSTPLSPSITTTMVGDFSVAVMAPGATATGINGGNEYTSDTTLGGNVGVAHLTSNSATAAAHQAQFTQSSGSGYVTSVAAFKIP